MSNEKFAAEEIYFIIEGEHDGGYVVWKKAFKSQREAQDAVHGRIRILGKSSFEKFQEHGGNEWSNGVVYLHIETLELGN